MAENGSWTLVFLCLISLSACDSPPDSGLVTGGNGGIGNSKAGNQGIDVKVAMLPLGPTDLMLADGHLLVEQGCLYFTEPAASGRRSMLAFQDPSVRWDGGTNTLRVGETRYSSGDLIRVSGNDATQGEIMPRSWVRPPSPSCDLSRVFIASGLSKAP